jgi:hypothetical protein
VNPSQDIAGGSLNIAFKGWHGDPNASYCSASQKSPPPLLTYVANAENSFKFSVKGQHGLGKITAVAKYWHSTLGWQEATFNDLPGPSCEELCAYPYIVNFDELPNGKPVETQYESSGVIFAAANNTSGHPNRVEAYDLSAPRALEKVLGAPNKSFGGPGEPARNYSTGAGVGNFVKQGKGIVIPDGSFSGGVESAGGSIILKFPSGSGAQFCSAKLINPEKKAVFSFLREDGSVIYSSSVSARGQNAALHALGSCNAGDEYGRYFRPARWWFCTL